MVQLLTENMNCDRVTYCIICKLPYVVLEFLSHKNPVCVGPYLSMLEANLRKIIILKYYILSSLVVRTVVVLC